MELQDYFDRLNVRFYKKGTEENYLYKVARALVRKSANVILPFYLKHTKRRDNKKKAHVIVSLTSFPARINQVWFTIETLKRQSVLPDKIILWLSKEQFPTGLQDIPVRLRDQLDQLFEIRFVEKDLRPHKKYLYSFKEFPERIIITVDDDIFYNSQLIESLLKFHDKYPDCVICNRGQLIAKDTSYSKWETIRIADGPSFNILPTGVGGVLYPPHIYDNHIFDKDAIMKTCLRADDLWLNFMCRYKGTMAVATGLRIEPITISASQKEALCKTNNGERNENDIQIQSIDKWAKETLDVNYFCNVK